MEKNYVGALISDIHWGAFSGKRLYEELQIFLDYIKDCSILDYIIIAGDYFDEKLFLNSIPAYYSLKFFKELLQICKDKNIKLRMIKGTGSHDVDQLKLLTSLNINNEVDFKIFEKVQDEYLFDNLHILYIPEEYVDNIEEYFTDYINDDKLYDLIIYHGLVNDNAFVGISQESEKTHKKAPIFKTENLLKCTKGCVMAGHDHTPKIIKDRYYVIGSYSCWAHGEEENKGFYMLNYSPKNGNYTTEFIVNTKRQRYLSVNIKEDSDLFKTNDLKESLEYLLSINENMKYDNLRFVINIPEDYQNTDLLVNSIKTTFSRYRDVKVVFKNLNEEKQNNKLEEAINLLKKKYWFLFEKEMPYEESISRFIKIAYNKDIDVDFIRNTLYTTVK